MATEWLSLGNSPIWPLRSVRVIYDGPMSGIISPWTRPFRILDEKPVTWRRIFVQFAWTMAISLAALTVILLIAWIQK